MQKFNKQIFMPIAISLVSTSALSFFVIASNMISISASSKFSEKDFKKNNSDCIKKIVEKINSLYDSFKFDLIFNESENSKKKIFSLNASEYSPKIDDNALIHALSSKESIFKDSDEKFSIKFNKNKLKKDFELFIEQNSIDPTSHYLEIKNGTSKTLTTENFINLFEKKCLELDDSSVKVNAIEFNSTISTTTSTFKADESHASRVANVKTAAKAIDGIVIVPGEEFSFADRIDWKNNKGLYFNAKNFRNSFEPGIGICQVSTNLFLTALRSPQIAITSRSNHIHKVPYAPTGLDSSYHTTEDGQIIKNLKFINKGSTPIKIKTDVKENQVTVSLLGNKHFNEDNLKVSIDVKKVEETDKTDSYVATRTIYETADSDSEPIVKSIDSFKSTYNLF